MLTQEYRARQAFEEVRTALADVRTQMGSLTFAMPQDVAAVHALVEQVLARLAETTAAMERQMTAEREARAASERSMLQKIAVAHGARVTAEQQLAEVRALLAAAESALAAERARQPAPVPAPVRQEPADYKVKFKRGADGKIDGDSVVIQRIPRRADK